MPTLVYVNPLKPGKLAAYKAFTTGNETERKLEYIDLLKRYGLKNAKAYHHRLNGADVIIVVHDAEDNAQERLANFNNSTHPFDQWFVQQLIDLHDLTEAGEAQQFLNFVAY